MSFKVSAISKLLLLSVCFTMTLLLVRFYFSSTTDYSFYGWNTFLAAIPYFISTQLLKIKKLKLLAIMMLAIWLLFFPNAPYIITDLFHYEERLPIPYWYDLMLVISGAWNGLILGMVSLMNVENFLARHIKSTWVNLVVVGSLFLGSYGVFIGRFLRFNSWNVVTDPRILVYTSAHHVLLPRNYPKLWVFTILFAAFLGIIYYTLQHLPRLLKQEKE